MMKELTEKVTTLVRKTGAFIRQERQRMNFSNIRDKSHNSFVTELDIASEKRLVEGLSRILPEAGFLTEEETVRQEHKELEWIVDPIDGTTNFIHCIPLYSISVALLEGGKPVIGVVYSIATDELFYTWKGGETYLNGKVKKVSKAGTLPESLLVTGFPYEKEKWMDIYLAIFKEFMLGSQGLRRLGSAAIDLAYVAAGRFDGFYEHHLHAWDVAAGILLVENAGGEVSDFSGGGEALFGGEIIASNGLIHDSMREVIARHFFPVGF